jgi:hypothetical protein
MKQRLLVRILHPPLVWTCQKKKKCLPRIFKKIQYLFGGAQEDKSNRRTSADLNVYFILRYQDIVGKIK